VLLDFHLPDMDASEVIERLRPSAGELPAIPVVVMTGSVRDPPVSALVRAGAMGFIGKDWLGPASLTRVLENALERHALFAEQQRLLQDLRAREQQLRLAQRAARLGLWDWDVVRGDVGAAHEVPKAEVHQGHRPARRGEHRAHVRRGVHEVGRALDARQVDPDGTRVQRPCGVSEGTQAGRCRAVRTVAVGGHQCERSRHGRQC